MADEKQIMKQEADLDSQREDDIMEENYSRQQEYVDNLENEPEEMANEDLEADINYFR